jgi:hypothetical protein
MSNQHNGDKAPDGVKDQPQRLFEEPSRDVQSRGGVRPVVIFTGLVLMVAVLLLVVQFRTVLVAMENRLNLDAAGDGRIQAIGQQLEGLRGKLNGLLAESVEIRLKSLEQSIADGKVNGDEMAALQSLQNDFRQIETYSSVTGGVSFDSARGEHPRFQSVTGPIPARMGNQELLREIARLRTLFYLCLTGLVAGAGVMGARQVWIRTHKTAQLGSTSNRQPLLTRSRPNRKA